MKYSALNKINVKCSLQYRVLHWNCAVNPGWDLPPHKIRSLEYHNVHIGKLEPENKKRKEGKHCNMVYCLGDYLPGLRKTADQQFNFFIELTWADCVRRSCVNLPMISKGSCYQLIMCKTCVISHIVNMSVRSYGAGYDGNGLMVGIMDGVQTKTNIWTTIPQNSLAMMLINHQDYLIRSIA